MFDKVLASVRIGAAEVDTRLDHEVLYPGEEFSAEVVVEGGNTDQEIEGLELQLAAELNRDDSDDRTRDEVLRTWRVTEEDFLIREGERKVIPFEAQLPYETPVTTVDAPRQYSKVWIHTGMAIDNALDAKDKDYLPVAPTEPMAAMLQAVDNVGFRWSEITLDPDRIRVGDQRSNLPVDQEFVLEPAGISSPLEETEIHFLPRRDKTHVLVEFDYQVKREQFYAIVIDHDDYSVRGLENRFKKIHRKA